MTTPTVLSTSQLEPPCQTAGESVKGQTAPENVGLPWGRPELKGWYRYSHPETGHTVAQHCDRATFFKYHVVGLFFPVEHHYLDQEAKTPPWITRMVLKFHSLDDFARYNFEWRTMYHRYFERFRGIDWDSHPTVENVAMFYTTYHMDFISKMGLHWTAAFTVWTRNPSESTRSLLDEDIASMFNKHTNDYMEAFRVEQTDDDPLSSRRRVFIKYPEQRHLSDSNPETIEDALDPDLVHVASERFCIKRNTPIQIDDPELHKNIENNIERQLFGEGEVDERPGKFWVQSIYDLWDQAIFDIKCAGRQGSLCERPPPEHDNTTKHDNTSMWGNDIIGLLCAIGLVLCLCCTILNGITDGIVFVLVLEGAGFVHIFPAKNKY